MAQVLALVGALGSLWWPLDPCSALVPHLTALAALGTVAALTTRRLLPAVALASFGVVGAWRLLPAPPPPAGDHQLTMLFANVLSANTHHQSLLDLVQRIDPEVVALVEVNRSWADALAPLRQRWSAGLVVQRSDNFGVALLSRVPLEDPHDVRLGPVPALSATLPGGPRLVVVHTLPPLGSEYAALHADQLATLRAWLDEGPAVVAGDLNATPWSAGFPSAVGWRPGTWPTFLPAPLRFPFDHVLTSGGVAVQLEVGPDIGSDHRPVLATLRW